ncbi:hypothetical protein GOP47_0006112 [Adiantum capillus-veneris]|uniref:Protein PRD1 n=1 Tax=Adiantum capillus-veneris TaxID=13818 RepID=A0A9D4V2Y6_ADICA|nr:hypothetical protein GOP47_0006112 [Adiantum capillus-veneris]
MAGAQADQLHGCTQSHSPSLQLSTDEGGSICLMCFVKLLSDHSAFLTHKLYAVSEFRQALNGPSFCANFFGHHSHFVVSPLSEALAHCRDKSSSCLAKALMELILDLCKLYSSVGTEVPHSDPASLLYDFVLHIIMEISSSSSLSYSAGQRNSLHVLGRLLDSYRHYDNVLPAAIQSYPDFLANLIAGLVVPGDQLRGELLFLLYKVSSFEGGIEQLLPFLSELTNAAINILEKTENDELRINCIALLSTMAQQSVISIRFQQTNVDAEAVPEHRNDFARAFAEALKGSLISSDSQVQVAALQLLFYMCSPDKAFISDLQILIEEGIMDYLFEILRVCENTLDIVVWSVRILRMLSEAKQAFTQRFALGLETASWILERSTETSMPVLQPDLLILIDLGLNNYPGAISRVSAERLLHILTAIIKNHNGDTLGLGQDSFISACSALLALLGLPCTPSIQEVHSLVNSAVSSTFMSVAAAGLVGLDCRMFQYAVLLLKGAFVFSLKAQEPVDCSFSDTLISIVEKVLLPCFLKSLSIIDNEDTVFAILEVLFLMIDEPSLLASARLGSILATASWFSVTYELMARFPARRIKDLIMNLLGSMICKLESGTLDENVKQQFTQLPSDPQESLVLLALSSIHDDQLKLIQFAVIKVLYFSHIYGDRFAEDSHVLAFLEQYLLMNFSTPNLLMNFSTPNQGSCSSCIFNQLLYIYILTINTAISCGLTYSLEAESLLASLVEQYQHNIISPNMHRSVFVWLIRTQSLESFMVASMIDRIKTLSRGEQGNKEKITTYPRIVDQEDGQPEDINFFLVAIEEEDCCGLFFARVLDEVLASQIEDDINTVVGCYIKLVKLSAVAANQLCLSGIVSNIRSWLAIYGARLPKIHSCLFELLYQLLCAVDHDRALDEESWGLLVNQFVHPLADKLNFFGDTDADEELFSLLSLMGLILHKSIENTGFLAQASRIILSHEQLQNSIRSHLNKFGARGCNLLNLVAESMDGKVLACILAFHLLCLRCAINTLRPTHCISRLAHSFAQPLEEDPHPGSLYNLVLPRSIEQVEHLCRLLYFGSNFVKSLASSCLAEAFNWLTQPGTDQSSLETPDARRCPEVLQSILMVLQGSVLNGSEVVCRNSSFCLYSLLVDTNLSLHEKAIIFGSPWHRFLVEDFVLAVSARDSASTLDPSAIYIAIGMLKQSVSPTWTKSVLSPCISAIISCLTAQTVSPATIVLLKELHGKGWLQVQHLEMIYRTLQTTRKIVYEEHANLDCSGFYCDQRHTVCSSFCRQDSDAECLLSYKHLINIAASCWLDPLTGVRYSIAEPYNSLQLLLSQAVQTTRKIVYEEHANLDCSGFYCDQRHTVCSSFCRQDSDAECLLSYKHLINIAASCWLDPLTGVRYSIAEPYNSLQLVSLIDEFLQETTSIPAE